MSNYEEHLPAYPLIQDEDFYKEIVKKKEFWGGNEDLFFRHQTNVARYMSQWTLYGSLFVVHEMGTGKSALTVAMTELARRSEFRKIIYVAHNQTQVANYKNEVRRFSTRLASSVHEDAPRFKWNAVLAKDGYEFYTFGTFAGEFSKHTDAWVRQHYDHSIFIVDEAHHLVQSNREEDKKSYQVLARVLSLTPRRKLLVMSGTPVRDQPDEVVPLLNLVLPPNKQLSRAKFVDEFFEVRDHVAVFGSIRIPIYGWKPDGKNKFMERTQGYVSYVKRALSGATIRYEGAVYPPMTNIRIVVHRMDPFQNMVYTDVFRKERLGEEEGAGGKSSFYAASKQASLFVFPDEQVGEKGFKANVTPHFALRAQLLEAIGDYRNMPARDVLLQLRQFSASYAYVIQQILDHPKELVCVFSDLVEGSGILLFMSILKTLFGFKLITSKNDLSDVKGERMILLNDRVANEDDFQAFIAYYNRPENKNGEYCQVVMTTNKTKEGISLRNVRQVHILTPSWNIADTAQAVSRSIRARAHDDLGGDAVVKVFLHASVPFTGDEDDEDAWLAGRLPITTDELLFSVDFQRYYRSEIKERNTKLIDRAFLEGSWDCLMNVPHNTRSGRTEDFSRECEYDECAYACWGLDDNATVATDAANYNAFYGSDEKMAVLTRIRTFFSQQSQVALMDFYQALQPDHNSILVTQCLQEVIDSPLVLRDYRRLPCFLSYKNGMLFLIDNPYLPASPDPYEAYYQRAPATRLERPLSDLLDGYFIRHRDRILPKLLRLMGDNNPNAKKLFLALPLVFQAEFCETMLLTQLTHPSQVSVDARSWFVREFKTDITYIPGVLIDHRFVVDKKHSRRLDLKNLSKGWFHT